MTNTNDSIATRNQNQQLLDYAVENITEWHKDYNWLRADESLYSLFYTSHDGWYLESYRTRWACDSGDYEVVDDEDLGKVTPQVITKDEWLAEIKRKKEIEMSKPLERTKEYDVKLTGEEIAWLQFATARSTMCGSLYKNIRKQFAELNGMPSSQTNGAGWDHSYRGSINAWYDELFPAPETEEQRHLRELKEQYITLGEKIKQMEK